jgi:transcriptional regulator with XRE-family HTH domain
MQKVPSRALVRKVFGKTVRSLRLKAGLSQENLALESHINRGYLGGLERGLHTPTLDTVYRLLGPLSITLTEFSQEFERILHMSGRPSGRQAP